MKKLLLILLCLPMIGFGQNVNIPDANFKAYLVGNTAINTNGDTEIQVSEAAAYGGDIVCYNMNIFDLTGIEAFTDLTLLNCSTNQLTNLDVSQNTALTTLRCNWNQLTNLDVSNNTALTTLRCANQLLASLDVSNNTALTDLRVGGLFTSIDLSNNTALVSFMLDIHNQLTNLDLSNNTALTVLQLSNANQLTSLDLSNNTALTYLSIYDANQFTSIDLSYNTALTKIWMGDPMGGMGGMSVPLVSLDVSNNTALMELTCIDCNLTSLDVSNNLALTKLRCQNNQLTSLDVSNNTALNTLYCYNNNLTMLDVRNGNNSNMTYFWSDNNPALSCISVDDTSWSTANWTNIDAQQFFSNYCQGGFGCTDSLACNYDSSAIIENGNCVYQGNTPILECWETAIFDTPTCTWLVAGSQSTSTTTITVCDSYSWNSSTYLVSGSYNWVGTDSNGCDSLAILNLTINSSTSNSTTATACDSYTWAADGNTYTTSGTYTDITTNAGGCDHTETLELTINNSTSSTDTHLACDEFMWYCDGNTYTTSNNTATYTYTNAAGCDSVVTLDLTINNSTSNSTTATACDSYIWAADGNTYTTSGTYTDISTNAGGCDHTKTLELTINYSPNTTNILGVTNVEFLQIETYSVGQNLNSIFSWHLNNGGIIVNGINTNSVDVQWGSIDGSYDLYVVETTQDGCSDTALIVVNANCLPNASSSTITACDSYSWEGETYTTSGTYTNTYINTAGCDSVHTLDLTIYSLVSSISQSGEVLSAVTTPIGLSADWYNVQTDNGETRMWLMEEDAPTFNPTFDCSYFIVVNDNGCIDTSETYSYGANAARIGSFVTSPNPTTALINVKFDNSKNQFVMF
jgi:Leucine-rich repeat (LRR) protein